MSDQKQKIQNVPVVPQEQKEKFGDAVEHNADHGPVKTEKSASIKSGTPSPKP